MTDQELTATLLAIATCTPSMADPHGAPDAVLVDRGNVGWQRARELLNEAEEYGYGSDNRLTPKGRQKLESLMAQTFLTCLAPVTYVED